MEYLKSYKVFEEENKSADLSHELKVLGKDLLNHRDELQDIILNIAKSDPDIKQKIEDRHQTKKDEDENQKETNEGLTLGLILSGPVIIEWTGKLLGYIGKKVSKDDQNQFIKAAESIEKFGHGIHHKVLELIRDVLKPLIFWMSPKKQAMVANVVFMSVLCLKISSGSIDPTDYASGADLAEGVLNSIKATEISSFLRNIGKSLITLVKSM